MLTEYIISLLDSLQSKLSKPSGELAYAYGTDFAVGCKSSCYGSCDDSCSGGCSSSCSGSCDDSCSGGCQYGIM